MTKEERKEYDRQRYLKNIEYQREKSREYYKKKKKTYFLIKSSRARFLNNSYISNDKEHCRGECTLTPQWIVDNIFSKPCHYCGETDWTKLGCDRIDNSKPHTPDNVVPCCKECNLARQGMKYEDFIKFFQ